MKRYIKVLALTLTVMLMFSGCSYLEAVKRAKQNESNKGTKAYYDNKCLVAEECASVSAKVYIPGSSSSDAMIVAVVVEDGNESRVIDAEYLAFSQNRERKSSYFFFDLPVGQYTIYALNIPGEGNEIAVENYTVVAKGTGEVNSADLEPYHNAIVLPDVIINDLNGTTLFSHSLYGFKSKLMDSKQRGMGSFDESIDLDDPIFAHQEAMEGLYYPDNFRKKTRPIYRFAQKHKEGSIPIFFVHGMSGTPRDWKFMLENLDLEKFTPYLVYYPTGDDFTKLSANYNAWIGSNKLFTNGPMVFVAHSFGGIIVRDALNLRHKDNPLLFISLATPYGGDAKAAEGVKNAPYVIPSWRNIADDSSFIKGLYRKSLFDDEKFELIFAFDNSNEGPSGDGRVPLEKQLRAETQQEAQHIRGFNEDHVSILKSEEAAAYIDTLLNDFARENANHLQK